MDNATSNALTPSAIPAAPSATTATQLRDIHLPSSPDLWPPAPGWWLLATLILFLCGWLFLKYLAIKKQKKRKKAVFSALKPIEKQLLNKPDNKTLADLNIVIRQLALMHYPQTEIASLNGRSWLSFLDESGKTRQFTQGAGSILAVAPYFPDNKKIDKSQAKALLKVVKDWIENAGVAR